MLIVARLLTLAYIQWALCMARCLVDKSFQFNQTIRVNLRHDQEVIHVLFFVLTKTTPGQHDRTTLIYNVHIDIASLFLDFTCS